MVAHRLRLITRPHRRTRPGRRSRGVWASVFAVLCAFALVLVWELPAGAIDVSGGSGPVTGNATWFSGLGAPYGGCGLPQADLDSQNFLALNVFNTPGNYGSFTRPIPASQASIMGMFDNGLNCGRFVQVTVGDYCTGTNDGAQNEPFCRNGSWVADQFNGAKLTFVVADSCADSNAWCRDDPYHVDLAQASLNQFVLNGAAVGDMYPNSWNNRQVSWQFVPAPNYTGDINIGFIQSAQAYWSAIAISHLPNGIHGVNYYSAGAWHSAQMNSDMGDDYIIDPTTAGGAQYQIQVVDASNNLVNGGRIYSFSFPTSCGSSCGQAYTPVTYTTSTPPTGTPTASASASSSASPSSSPTTTPPTTTPPAPPVGGTCAVATSLVGSWTGGYQEQFTVSNTGTTALSAWTVGFSFASSQTIASSWNAVVAQSGAQVTAGSESYNGALAPGGSTTWGMVVNGANQPLANLTCM
jgi:Cellulose binding domain